MTLLLALGCGRDSQGDQATGGVSRVGSLPALASGGASGGPASSAGAAGTVNPGWQWEVTCGNGAEPATPLEYGRCALEQARTRARSKSAVRVVLAGGTAPGELDAAVADKPESYVAGASAGTTWVVGRDEVGAMYGALELAERLTLKGASALPLTETLQASPEVGVRAVNPFLVLPEDGESEWWFQSEDYWKRYLDLMAHARINMVDIHGAYDLRSTIFPNALLWFARSPSFPELGAPPAERERNVAMLNRVVELGAARGIRVALMTYNALPSLDGRSPGALSDADLQKFTREATRDLATRVPGLSHIGFRIGESGRDASWYVGAFVAGVQSAGTPVGVSTRTWLAVKSDILQLAAAAGPGLMVESKFNGEHWGPPYAIAGGAFATWGSYSYQSYLAPPAPYEFVFQVRAGGTHRMFRQASYRRTQQTVRSLGFAPTVKGFTLETPQAYFPQRDGYHADTAERVAPWTFVRDELLFLLWGRLGYDSATSEDVFRGWLERETGRSELWEALQAASEIVPLLQTARSCGPDSRNFAPELETGGDLAAFAAPVGASVPSSSCYSQGPFDRFSIASPAEVADDLLQGLVTTRLSPVDVAARVLDAAKRASQVELAAANVVARDVARNCLALADLGRYFGHKLRAATALAIYSRSGRADYLAAARAESGLAGAAWAELGSDTAYIRPFTDALRMSPLGYTPFHWSMLTPRMADDAAAIDAVVSALALAPPTFTGTLPDATSFLASERGPGPGLTELSVSPADGASRSMTLAARFATPLPSDARVTFLWKPFDSERDFQRLEASAVDAATYQASLDGGGDGVLVAVEFASKALGGFRYPDPELGMPYVSVPPGVSAP